ncbi:hypothetical protein AJ80_06553 [Polytolypa hystricis UAMH7299]|uniref:F-box domain-containing protein n=1 Tax=Polytolypa hystricis (strain UAMH7299) TaxID=1447883 RepID=A0A2B7XM57_POLH7|nr:hypothetical protein AJ80_06553 [Polytolypa hystricis UAMH7299]
MDKLPVELLARILRYLAPHELAIVQLVSKRFQDLCRDNSLWRGLCYEAVRSHIRDPLPSTSSSSRSTGNRPGSEALFDVAGPGAQADGGSSESVTLGPATLPPAVKYVPAKTFATSALQWDPSYEGEDVNWYTDYVARHAPISVQWLQEPCPRSTGGEGDRKTGCEVKGIGLFKESSYGGSDRVIGPLDDGSLCLWDLSQSSSYNYIGTYNTTRGGLAEKSPPGILFANLSSRRGVGNARSPGVKGGNLEFIGMSDCVSIDSFYKTAYVAVGNVLNEVDLATLQVVSQQRYGWTIFALSPEVEYYAPLSVATLLSLNIYDPRCASSGSRNDGVIVDDSLAVKLRSPPQPKNSEYAALFQPGPLAVLHAPLPNINTILLAGRFPSVLSYDRRFFPRLQGVAHSGARICGAVAIPAPPRPYSNQNPDWQNSHTIVTCGEYKGRGSLELFSLSALTTGSRNWEKDGPSALARGSVCQNRQTASTSKLLSVASHGTRIVYSDGDGYIRWVERDGRTEVRRWNLSMAPQQQNRNDHRKRSSHQQTRSSYSLLANRSHFEINDTLHDMPTLSNIENWSSGLPSSTGMDVVRKIIPTGSNNVPDDELLFWTGERIGRLRFTPQTPQVWAQDESYNNNSNRSAANTAVDRGGLVDEENIHREREYAEQVNQSLRASRQELNWMGSFGSNV